MKVKSESEVAQSCPTQRPHGLQPTRLLHPWDSPGKSTGVGRQCHLHPDGRASLWHTGSFALRYMGFPGPEIEPMSPALSCQGSLVFVFNIYLAVPGLTCGM